MESHFQPFRSSANALHAPHISPFRELHGVPETKSPQTTSEPSPWQSSLNRRAASQTGAAVHRSTSPNASAEARTSAVASTSGRNVDTKPEAKVRGPKHQLATPPQPRRLITTPISPNLIVEPYRKGASVGKSLGRYPRTLSPEILPLRKEDACCRGEPPGIPWMAYFTKRGWKERWRRLLGGAKSVYTVAKCKRNLPDFDLKSFKSEAIKLYSDINSAVAVGDRTRLRHLVTPGEETNLKKQIKSNLKSADSRGSSRSSWSLAEPLTAQNVELIHARLMALDQKRDDLTYAQITVKFEAKVKSARERTKGHLDSQLQHGLQSQQDVWVFERGFMKEAHSRWRLAGRIIGIPPEFLERKSWRQRFTDWVYGSKH